MFKIDKGKGKFIVIVLIVCVLGLLYTIANQNNFFNASFNPFQFYVKLAAASANFILGLFNTAYQVVGTDIIISEESKVSFSAKMLELVWLPIILTLVWLTPTSEKRKRYISVISLFGHFVVITLKFASVVLFYNLGTGTYDAMTIGRAISYSLFIAFIWYWFATNNELCTTIAKLVRINSEYLKKKINIIFYILYALIASLVILAIFEFLPWINILFTSAHHILAWLGYNSTVEPFYLIGENVSIFMLKGCLGIKTTFIFCAFVFLTGEELKKRLVFILVGVILINIANLLRFVFLFIHLQHHGEYLWNLEVHDLFNIIIYSLVFVLWVIWIERFSDIWPYLKLKKEQKD